MRRLAWGKLSGKQLAEVARESQAFAEALVEPIKFRREVPAIGIEEDARAAVEALLADGSVAVEHAAAVTVVRVLLDSQPPALQASSREGTAAKRPEAGRG